MEKCRNVAACFIAACAVVFSACTKKTPEKECEDNEIFQVEAVLPIAGFMPMSTAHFWVYTDSAFFGTDSARVNKDVLMTPKQAFFYAINALDRPIMFQSLMEGWLFPDLAFYKDTVYLLDNFGMLRHGDCHQYGRAWLYPLNWGDTIRFEYPGSSTVEKCYRSSDTVVTPVGIFTDNYIVERYGFEQLVFNRQMGLIEYRWLPLGSVQSRILKLKSYSFPAN